MTSSIRRPVLLASGLLAVLVACGSQTSSVLPAADGGPRADASALLDASLGEDASETDAAVPPPDAAMLPDAGIAADAARDGSVNPGVTLVTTLGTINVELDRANAPIGSANFLRYVDKEFYDGTIFHRVIPAFMIQGGGYTADLSKPFTDPPIKCEADNGLKNLRGTIAYARTDVVDSATSQFYVNVVDNPGLDHVDDTPANFGYAVFGKVVSGMDVVDAIDAVKTTTKGTFTDIPETAVVITTARRTPP